MADTPFFSGDDSSASGEVQHKEAAFFSKQLGEVLKESARVLKSDGVLAFSFHHSRSEGWTAIYDALSSAGLTVVASHPLHAELRAASPKSAAKDPISLDAILVCRKTETVRPTTWSEAGLLKRVGEQAAELRQGGLYLSNTDLFVITAGELLASARDLTSAEFCRSLDALRAQLGQE